MKALDRFLQRWRIAQARPYIAPGTRVLDIGCADGALFRQLGARIGEGVGVDPNLERPMVVGRGRLVAGRFPQDLPDARPYDVITLLAVVEHVPAEHLARLAQDCARFLQPGGCLVITTPSAAVDRILDWLKRLRLIDGMSLDEHHGFDPGQTPALFSVGGLQLEKAARFQLGLNHLFVFRKRTAA